ncbi:MAG: hypothetical protein EXR01_03670 [Acetobacteraceae bacterium]|nr:hypothetical protein [Acetobacteraceae bacterium]
MIQVKPIGADREKRKRAVWDIERKLTEQNVRPIIFYNRPSSYWQPHVQNVLVMVNSGFGGHRREDIWLDR